MTNLNHNIYRSFIGLLFLSLIVSCRQEFVIPPTAANSNYLVVEGFLITGVDTNYIQLTRARNLESVDLPDPPETGARITVLNATGQVVCQSQNAGAGRYRILGARLQNNVPYQLKIETNQGGVYQSDLFTGKAVPPIGAINYQYERAGDRLNFTINTADPSNNTLYYRWNYEETWEYRADYESYYEYDGVNLTSRPPENQIYRCWAFHSSTEIILGTSAKLANDIIENAPLLSHKRGGNRFNNRYSILVHQYPLQKEAFDYWQNLQKLTEQAGSIFDAQPTELFGNIKNLNNALEPVIGFISAGAISNKRIFIDRFDMPEMVVAPVGGCEVISFSKNPDSLKKYLGNLGLTPLFDAPGLPNGLSGVAPNCADCRLIGGTTTRPSFW